MKKIIVITSLITASALSINSAQAGSKNENVGFASGALTGAAVGGPVGMIVGGTLGAIFGDQVEKATQLEQVEIELAQAHATQQRLISEIEQKNEQQTPLKFTQSKYPQKTVYRSSPFSKKTKKIYKERFGTDLSL